MRDLFRTNWNWDRFLSLQVYFCFHLAAAPHHRCSTLVFIFFKHSNASADVRMPCKEEKAYLNIVMLPQTSGCPAKKKRLI